MIGTGFANASRLGHFGMLRMFPQLSPGWRRRGLLGMIATVIAIEAAVIGFVYLAERSSLRASQNTIRPGRMSGETWWTYESEGVVRPPVKRANESRVGDDEPVLGVVVEGKARAYRLSALLDPSQHIINDMIGNRPVTVAYCDVFDCARGYTSETEHQPLDVSLVGLRDGDMIVKIAGVAYLHESGQPLDSWGEARPLPYDDLPVTRTTWKDWKAQHPDTEIFVGSPTLDADSAGSPPTVPRKSF